MIEVELIYDNQCPNLEAARRQLSRALCATQVCARWREWERSCRASPSYVSHYGSPSILVNGQDVEPQKAKVTSTGACRIYAQVGVRLSGVPPLAAIEAALRAAARESGTAQTFARSLPALPSVGLALLPKLTCAACWPAYAALLSAFGISFVDYTPYLLPFTALFLAVTLLALAYDGRGRHGYGPLALGVLACAIVLAAKFAFDSDGGLYSGAALLIGASVWNAWPARRRGPCADCTPRETRLPVNAN